MIKYNFIIVLILLGYSQVYAQFENVNSAIKGVESMKLAQYANNSSNSNVSLEEYYNQDWRVANITFNNNFTQKFDNVRYNFNKKEVEIQYNDKVYSLPAKEVNKLIFTQLGKKLISNKNKNIGLLEEYYKNKNIVFVIAYNQLKVEQKSTGYGLQEDKSKTKKVETYYLIKNNNDLFKLSKNKKKNAKFFAEDWDKVEGFIKKENVSFKKKDDIIKVVEFYTSLKG